MRLGEPIASLAAGDFSHDGRPDFVDVIPANPTEFALYTKATP